MDLIFTKYMKALVSYEGINRQERFFFPPDAIQTVRGDYGGGLRGLVLTASIRRCTKSSRIYYAIM